MGSRRWFVQQDLFLSNETDRNLSHLEEQQSTVVLAAINKKPVAAFVLFAPLKPEACQVVSTLSRMNLSVVMLTGDNSRTANALAKEVRP